MVWGRELLPPAFRIGGICVQWLLLEYLGEPSNDRKYCPKNERCDANGDDLESPAAADVGDGFGAKRAVAADCIVGVGHWNDRLMAVATVNKLVTASNPVAAVGAGIGIG